jgi:hypothetical protein
MRFHTWIENSYIHQLELVSISCVWWAFRKLKNMFTNVRERWLGYVNLINGNGEENLTWAMFFYPINKCCSFHELVSLLSSEKRWNQHTFRERVDADAWKYLRNSHSDWNLSAIGNLNLAKWKEIRLDWREWQSSEDKLSINFDAVNLLYISSQTLAWWPFFSVHETGKRRVKWSIKRRKKTAK